MEQIKLGALPKIRQQLNIWNKFNEIKLTGKSRPVKNYDISLWYAVKGIQRKQCGYTLSFRTFFINKDRWEAVKFAVDNNNIYITKSEKIEQNAIKLSGHNRTLTNKNLVEFIIDFTGHTIPVVPDGTLHLKFTAELVAENIYQLKII
jgi:hypothetical protein